MFKRVNCVLRITLMLLVGWFVWHHYDSAVQYSTNDQEALDLLVEQLLKGSQKKRPEPKARAIEISDGKFEELSQKWRDGIHWLITTGKCQAYDHLIWHMVSGNRFKYLLAKAQMMVESGCRFDVLGGETDHGLFQVQTRACEDVGIKGDLFDPKTNVTCALAYHRKLCESYGKCSLTDMLVAYNVGPTGSNSVLDKRAHQYPRKIEYALRQLLRREGKSGV